MRSFRRNRRGIVWVWVVWVIAVFFISLVWLVFLYPVSQLTETVEDAGLVPSEGQTTIDFLKTLYFVSPVIMIFGLTVWAYLRAQRPQEVTYPYG